MAALIGRSCICKSTFVGHIVTFRKNEKNFKLSSAFFFLFGLMKIGVFPTSFSTVQVKTDIKRLD